MDLITLDRKMYTFTLPCIIKAHGSVVIPRIVAYMIAFPANKLV
jgi:hypothetical protein